MDRSVLLVHRASMFVEERRKMDRLLESFRLPGSRQQWEHWAEENLTEVRANMASTPTIRRQGSSGLRARPDFPTIVSRIQARPIARCDCCADWAHNLRNRMGWHGIKTRLHGVLVVFLIVLHRRTHYLSIHNRSVTGDPPRCILDTTFSVRDSVHELAHLEQLLLGDVVLRMWD